MSRFTTTGSGLVTSDVTQMPGITPYVAPNYDYGRLDQLTQELASPNIRRLRSGLREAFQSAQGVDNPAARAMMMRRSLEGYGTGLEGAIGSARAGAMNSYGAEYEASLDASRLAWTEEAMRQRLKWQADEQNRTQEDRLSAATPRPTNTVQYLNHDPLASLHTGGSGGPSSSGYWGPMYMNQVGGGNTAPAVNDWTSAWNDLKTQL